MAAGFFTVELQGVRAQNEPEAFSIELRGGSARRPVITDGQGSSAVDAFPHLAEEMAPPDPAEQSTPLPQWEPGPAYRP